jgi:signal peptidase II
VIEFVIAAAVAVTADQAAKRLVIRRGVPVVGHLPQPPALLLLGGLTAAAAVIVLRGPVGQCAVARAGLGAALGGATANVVDTLRHGGVVDFIQLGPVPLFNIADVAIVGGVGAALWCVL